MPWGVAAAAVGAYGAMSASSDAADAQNNATAAATSSADKANQLSRDQFDWQKQTYENDIKPQQQKAADLQNRIGEESLSASQQQRQFASDQNQYYKDTFQPIEKKVADEAMNYDSADNVNRRSGIASANVNQQFSNARGQSARLAGRYGLGSTSFSGPAGASERAEALGSAGAATGAAFDTMDKGIALRAGAANFGRNMPNTAASFSGIGNQSSAVASGAATSGLNSTLAGANYMGAASQQNINNTLNTGGLLAGAYQNSANAYNNAASGYGTLAGYGLYTAGKGGSNPFSGIGNTVSNWFSGSGGNTYGMDAGTAAMTGLT